MVILSMNSSAMLFLAVTISMAVGILLPQFSKIFGPYLLVWLGGLLFFNLIQLNTSELVSVFVWFTILYPCYTHDILACGGLIHPFTRRMVYKGICTQNI